ncbi:MAG: hypothetical protein ACR2LF_05635 [Jatrophihabitantaceae bacterium]
MVVVGSAITAESRATVDTTILNNGRGAYDLLVTAGRSLGAAAAEHAGLIEANFAGLGATNGIGEDQLSAIRDVAGVDVAAPLAYAGQLTSPAYGVLVGAHDPDGAVTGFFTEQPKVFDVRVTVTTSDGIRTQTLSTEDCTMALSRTGRGHSARAVMAVSGAGTANTANLSADVTIPGVPELTTGLVAVDPVAERKLLGPRSSFLAPLEEVANQASPDADALARLIPDRFALERAPLQGAQPGAVFVPVVVSDSAYAHLAAAVSVTPVDVPASGSPTLFAEAAQGLGQLTPAGLALIDHSRHAVTLTTTYDLTHRVAPFSEPNFTIALPGASPPQGAADTSAPVLLPRALTAPSFGPTPARAGPAPDGAAADVTVRGLGYAALPGGAAEQTYRELGPLRPITRRPVVYAPLGTYHPGDVSGSADRAAYVPLGTYSPGSATVRQPGGSEGAHLGPSFSGRGLELAPPGGITTLSALRQFEPNARIDVVRVRVAGPTSYTHAMVEKIDKVAAQIAGLGLQVRVVAGSSLTPVNIFVPHYFESAPGGAKGTDLGWVQEEWTSLGAAVRVHRANLSATVWLLVITLTAVVGLWAVVLGIALDGRRREAAFLRQLGWRRRRVFAWFLTEGSFGPALVALASIVTLFLNTGSPLSRSVSAVAPVLAAILAVGAAWSAARDPRDSVRRITRERPRIARTPHSVGARAASGRHPAVIFTVLALISLGTTAVAFGAVLQHGRAASGGSRLAGLVTERLLLPQTLLAVLSCLACGILFAVGLSLLRSAIAGQLRMISCCGWSRRELASLMRGTIARPIVVALSLGVVVTLGLAFLIGGSRWWQLTLAGIALMALVSAMGEIVLSHSARHLVGSTALPVSEVSARKFWRLERR